MGLTMDVVIKILRVLTAVIVPVTGVALTLLTVIKVTQDKGKLPEEGRRCLREKVGRDGSHTRRTLAVPEGDLSSNN
jgi:hypothetical protein